MTLEKITWIRNLQNGYDSVEKTGKIKTLEILRYFSEYIGNSIVFPNKS